MHKFYLTLLAFLRIDGVVCLVVYFIWYVFSCSSSFYFWISRSSKKNTMDLLCTWHWPWTVDPAPTCRVIPGSGITGLGTIVWPHSCPFPRSMFPTCLFSQTVSRHSQVHSVWEITEFKFVRWPFQTYFVLCILYVYLHLCWSLCRNMCLWFQHLRTSWPYRALSNKGWAH